MKSAAGESMKTTQSAIACGVPKSPDGIGNDSIALAVSGSSSCACRSGVRMAPGAIALSRIPAPIHSGDVAARRSHLLSAIFEPP